MAATTTYVDDEILRASARGIFIASCDGDDNNTGNDERRVSDGEASCARKHTLIAYCDGDEDNEVKRTCYASNIDAPTSQATSNIDRHELNCQT
jgi:hypothetical protein